MKRIVKLLALTVALVAVLAVSAFAADFTHCADALKDLGLFQGTDTGYDLDRAPTRAEAATMLVRLLGAEEDAKALTYSAPFTDVRDWAKPYVQYLYENGLTNGKSETIFGSSDKCTAQQYATFLMRALGYSDAENGDFTYATALDFAREKGVVDVVNCDEQNFLRDDVVAMSYTALATAPKSGEADLLTKLVKDGAIADAKGYDAKFELFREYTKAASADANATKTSMTVDMNMDMKLAGVSFVSGSVKLDAAMDLNTQNMDQSKMAMTGSINMAVDEAVAEEMDLTAEDAKFQSDLDYYYTDGYYYMTMADAKLKMPLSFEEVMGQMEGLTNTNAVEPISMLKDITSAKSGATTTYTLTYSSDAMNALMNTVLGMMPADVTAGTEMPGLAMDDLKIAVDVQNGHMTAMSTAFNMNTTVEGQTMAIALDMKISNIKTGSAVTVKLPTDLSTYEEIIGGVA